MTIGISTVSIGQAISRGIGPLTTSPSTRECEWTMFYATKTSWSTRTQEGYVFSAVANRLPSTDQTTMAFELWSTFQNRAPAKSTLWRLQHRPTRGSIEDPDARDHDDDCTCGCFRAYGHQTQAIFSQLADTAAAMDDYIEDEDLGWQDMQVENIDNKIPTSWSQADVNAFVDGKEFADSIIIVPAKHHRLLPVNASRRTQVSQRARGLVHNSYGRLATEHGWFTTFRRCYHLLDMMLGKTTLKI